MTITEAEARERMLDAINFTETANMGATPAQLLDAYRDAVLHAAAEPRPFPHGFQRVQGRCPACRMSALFLGDGGYVTCGNLQCTNPCAATELLEQP